MNGDTIKRVFSSVGSCNLAGGCDYDFTDIACVGCPNCTTDPCLDGSVVCDAGHAPAPAVCYLAPGTCSEGSCSYAFDNTQNCDDGDGCTIQDRCDQGVCSGQPRVCDQMPDPVCASTSSIRHFNGSGTCTGGSCQYGYYDLPCILGTCSGTPAKCHL
jgi:hypothetical protein